MYAHAFLKHFPRLTRGSKNRKETDATRSSAEASGFDAHKFIGVSAIAPTANFSLIATLFRHFDLPLSVHRHR
jgi:hypothetical protein